MRYILNNEGYICNVSFGAAIECSLGTCTEYKGTVPNGYSTIEDWHEGEIDRLNAWKVVDGNLVFDASKHYKLQILYEQQQKENAHITRKELGITNTNEVNPYANLFPSKQSTSWGYISYMQEVTEETGELPVQEIELSMNKEQNLELIELEFIGTNFLPNTATTCEKNGIRYTQNIDKTLTIMGMATDKSTLNLAGTDTSIKNIFTFKQGIEVVDDEGNISCEPYEYILLGLTDEMELEFYHYNGTDRTLIGTYKNNDVISFDEDTNVTQIVLTIASGTTMNATITPMLRLVSSDNYEYEYEEYKNNSTLIDLAGNTFTLKDRIIIKNNEVILIKNDYYIVDEETGVETYMGEGIYLGSVAMPRTYTPYTHAYCHQLVNINFKYKDPRNIEMTNINLRGSLTIDEVKTDNLLVNDVSVEENITTAHEIPTTTFLNGHRIYKRLYTGTMPSATGYSEMLAPLNFFDYKEIWIDQSLSYLTRESENIPTNFFYTNTDYLRVWVSKDGYHVRYKAGQNLSSFNYNIVVAYTKDGYSVNPGTLPKVEEVNKTSTINGSTSSNLWTFKTVATETKIDRVNKTSTIKVENYIGRASSSSYFMGTLTNTYNCAGRTYSETVYKNSGTVVAGGWFLLGSHTFTITHTSEPMTINVGGSMSTSAFNPSSASASGNITLTQL